jgi:hypothetical protein
MEGCIERIADDATAMLDKVVPSETPRHTRRLSDKILIAFHQACDMSDLKIAEYLLQLLEVMLTRASAHVEGNRRRNTESFVAAHERLWHLRRPPADQ